MIVHLTTEELIHIKHALRIYRFYESKARDLLRASGSQEVLASTEHNLEMSDRIIESLNLTLVELEDTNYVGK